MDHFCVVYESPRPPFKPCRIPGEFESKEAALDALTEAVDDLSGVLYIIRRYDENGGMVEDIEGCT